MFAYVFETVAKSAPDTAGPAVDPPAFFPAATVEAALVFDPAGADAVPLFEAGVDADALDMAHGFQMVLKQK